MKSRYIKELNRISEISILNDIIFLQIGSFASLTVFVEYCKFDV